MNDQGGNSRVSKTFDWLKEIIERVRNLLIALGALIAAAIPLTNYLRSSPPPVAPSVAAAPAAAPAAPSALSDCYQVDVVPHETISISSAKSGNSKWFDLVFVNTCKVDLMVRVEYKQVTGGIVISPPDSWPGYVIRAGKELRRAVTPPNLQVLTDTPQTVQILVSIYRKDNQELIGEDTVEIRMVA